ncbi:MAG TPA: phosphatidate cytidylyltransferase [Hyphomicrobiales bacterium]|nr:phosphatidate cytidylyltransferase [Hyphomicrobiales bacterium]
MTRDAGVLASRGSELALRIASAIVLAALALGAAWAGGGWLAAFWAVAAVGTLVEWWRLTAPGGPIWQLAGVVYAAILVAAPVVLRGDPAWGFAALLWLYAAVWLSDIMAFACGRALGGPKLWPRLSPKKTWSGLLGGTVAGTGGAVAVAWAAGAPALGPVALLSFVVALASQGGDLLESALKRRFGAKDSSHVIPGHGGIMDRIDGFVTAAALAALVGVLRAGLGHAGEGVLAW